jgi:hypothetical protein
MGTVMLHACTVIDTEHDAETLPGISDNKAYRNLIHVIQLLSRRERAGAGR